MTRRRSRTVNSVGIRVDTHATTISRWNEGILSIPHRYMADEVRNGPVIRPNGTISAEQARVLLRRFRDLNLGPCGIDVSQEERVQVSGCISLDHPVERGVRYCVAGNDGVERVLAMYWDEGRLLLHLRRDRRPDSPVDEELFVDIACDGLGRLSSPELGARMSLEESDAREVEHFLRRIVRAVYTRER